ncbi:MAG: ABC transporter substrate-binding protein [Proteobacteria bacterium]|nr:ABC transporter substrate-binding protein [Pseudomonadota bacterium]
MAEVLAAVGAEGDVVGVVQHTDEPASMRRLPRVASARGVALEAALRLEPTLAIAYTAGLPGLRRLEKLGVRVAVSHPRGVSEALDEIERIGRLAGRPRRAGRLADGLRGRLEAIRARRPRPPPRVFYEVAAEPLIGVGPGNFLDDVLREAGAVNVFADAPVANPRVSVEAVLRAGPDVLVLPGEPRQSAERARFWRRRFGAQAPPHLPVPPDLLHRPGPRLIDGLEILQAGLLERSAEAPR